MKYILLTVLLILVGCDRHLNNSGEPISRIVHLKKIFMENPDLISKGFQFPVGKDGSANGYYVAQGFQKRNKRFGGNFHLGEDWNGNGGGDTDLGDPVYSIANGIVVFSGHGGRGWGNVIRIVHSYPQNKNQILVESVYGHVLDMFVSEGDHVKIGEKIATIGNADGLYHAHLHLEIRTDPDMELGGGYAPNTYGFTEPRAFIRKNKDLKVAGNP
ncbi:MAG: M23 family metallopeptidase [Leptospiraceae bacterium]|nr:M23 family metallopeptidase [Leptospiraceae bacterium]